MKISTTFFSLAIILLIPVLTLAATPVANYIPLIGLPGVSGDATFEDFINSLYFLSISIAGLLAVIKIIIAGVRYMLTDIVTSKEAAKSDIRGALVGLLVVLGAVMILTVINPQLTNIDSNLKATPIKKGSGVTTNNNPPTITQTLHLCSTSKCEDGKTACADTRGTFITTKTILGGQLVAACQPAIPDVDNSNMDDIDDPGAGNPGGA